MRLNVSVECGLDDSFVHGGSHHSGICIKAVWHKNACQLLPSLPVSIDRNECLELIFLEQCLEHHGEFAFFCDVDSTTVDVDQKRRRLRQREHGRLQRHKRWRRGALLFCILESLLVISTPTPHNGRQDVHCECLALQKRLLRMFKIHTPGASGCLFSLPEGWSVVTLDGWRTLLVLHGWTTVFVLHGWPVLVLYGWFVFAFVLDDWLALTLSGWSDFVLDGRLALAFDGMVIPVLSFLGRADWCRCVTTTSP